MPPLAFIYCLVIVNIRRSLFVLVTALFAYHFSSGQGEANWWYFGANAGLNFNNTPPTPAPGGQINTIEGVASISNAAGQLLFYTDGMRVWNRNHIQMPNGAGLMGSSSSSQSAVVVKRPGSNNLYYIFTCDAQAAPNGIRYSEVDMNLSAGNGDVTANKNILIYTPSTERICAVRHCNNVDVWIVTHHWGSNEFRSYLVTAAGVNMTPVISAIGPVHTGSNTSTIGYLKVSPDGSKLAMAIRYTFAGGQPGWCELYDFNNSTGAVTNLVNLGNHSYAYGCEFSPDNRILYTTASQPGQIYQFNLCAGTAAQIVASRLTIGNSASGWIGPLQLGPDGKIYNARYQVTWLGVINNPNVLGMGCGYVDNGQTLGTMQSTLGLPNFLATYFRPPPVASATMNCLNGTFSFTYTQSGCNPAVPAPLWNFGDPGSGPNNTSTLTNPTHTFSAPGNYIVTLINQYACYSDTDTIAVTAISCGPTVTMQSATICQNSCTTITANASGGTPPYTYAWSPNIGAGPGPHNVCPTSTTTYTVVVTDAGGGTMSNTATVTVNPPPTVSATGTGPACNINNGSATASPTGPGPFSYSWSTIPAQTSQTATGLSTGTYTVTVTDPNGCTATATVTLSPPPAVTASAVSTPPSCASSNNGTATATPSGGTGPFTYLWNPSNQTTQTATSLSAGTYTVTITDANGCTATATVTITAPPVLTSATSSTPPACANSNDGTATANPSGGTGPYTYSWTPSSQTTQTASNLTPGNYTVTVTDANGCTATATVTIGQPAGLQLTVAAPPAICISQCANLTANMTNGSPPFTFTWMPGNLNGQNVQACPTATTSYTVTVTDASGCTGTTTVQVAVRPPLSLNSNATGPVCPGAQATLTANGQGGDGGPYNFTWNPGNLTGSPVTVNPTTTTVYTVTITDNCGSPSQTSTVTVTVFPLPAVAFAGDSLDGCAPLCVNFTNSTPNSSACAWNFGNLGNSSNCNDQFCFPTPGSYSITLTVTDNNGCTNTQTLANYINVYPVPAAAFSMTPETTTLLNPNICFSDLSSGASSWDWDFNDPNDNTGSTIQNPCHMYSDTGIYCVTLTVQNSNGCRSTATKCVEIDADVAVFIPNAFTPNGDIKNEFFMPEGIGIDPDEFHMWIFDRWGNLIWETNQWGKGWDGKANGGSKIAQQDVYVWKIELKDVNGFKHAYVGHVSLIR